MDPLWQPDAARIEAAQLTRFQRDMEHRYGRRLSSYADVHQWSVDQPEEFWQGVWDFAGIQASVQAPRVLLDGNRFPGARWFDGARLNFAENLLRYRDDRVALVSVLENGRRRQMTYAELYVQVARVASAMRNLGIRPGDRVAALMPNVLETAIGMLAATSLGATWSSCSPDFGVNGVMDRFGQIRPRLLIACDGYFYNGKQHTLEGRLRDIVAQIDSLAQVVVVPVLDSAGELAWDVSAAIPGALSWSAFVPETASLELSFEQLPFGHPLYILYSSGTTGVPKCIVHGVGGTLLQHAKEYLLHMDVRREDVFFYFTTCGWTMWNILLSSLLTGCTAVMYDGSPFYPGPAALIDLMERERISVFGVSAKYLAGIEKHGVKPVDTHDLACLKTILSTGSPLSPESFHYVYRDIKRDICLSSICGGTDIISAFVAGSPTLPVYAGELQCKGLGMAVEIWDDNGTSVEQQKGELVCVKPFPSCPNGFWNDDDGFRFRTAYFERYPGVWAQGDYAEITSHGGMIVYGRSDAVLNPGGVRIGTAEIYRQVEKIHEVLDSVCIGQDWNDDVRVVLFVVLRDGLSLDDALRDRIRRQIRDNTTPRHVPAKIIQVRDIPRTISGKIVELAVRNVVHGKPVKNTDALANPEALNLFANLGELDS